MMDDRTHEPVTLNSVQRFWLDNRSAILDAIDRAGYILMSNQYGFFLHKKNEGARDAAAMAKEIE
jgi:hypothetical protein